MKINIFTVTRAGQKFAGDSIHSSITGESIGGPLAPEDQIITEIDELKMSPEKIIATRFLAFLETRSLDMKLLAVLSDEEQNRIRREFFLEQ